MDISEEIDPNDISTSIKIMDDEDDEIGTSEKKPAKRVKVKKIIGQNNCILKYIFVNALLYDFKDWKKCFPDNKINLRALMINSDWDTFFDSINGSNNDILKGIERILSDHLKINQYTIVPPAELVFTPFNIVSPEDIKVVIIGQDPYPGANQIGNKMVPDATGLCFSAPVNSPIPASLNNIYKNLLKFKHIDEKPDTGNLGHWALQGCFMINSAFTNFYSQKDVHKETWKVFTNKLINFLNTKLKNLVFIVWGGNAHRICLGLNADNHCIITSSHPSPLGADKKLNGYAYKTSKKVFGDNQQRVYPAFLETDHFGQANKYLKLVGKTEIIW